MRLIDADAIHYCNYDLDNYHSFRAIDEDEVAEMPTIDAVPVVRCKDCKHYSQNPWNTEKELLCKCWGNWLPTSENDFCSYGERKDNV